MSSLIESFFDTTNAMCGSTTQQTGNFITYINTCKTSNDVAVETNFLTGTINKYKEIFSSHRAQYDNLIITGNNLVSLTGNTDDIDSQIDSLTKQQTKLTSELNNIKTQTGSYDKTFLEDIYNGKPEKKLAPTLQDVALLLFWFGWLLMSIVLIAVRVMSPGGTFQAGLFVFVILLLTTLCVFAIINYVA